MARYSEVVYQQDFTGKTMKDAYLKACKWYASNILSKDELHDVQVEYIKDKQYPSVTMRLFCSVEEQEVKSHHCAICKEVHKNYYMNENINCGWCKVSAFHNRIADVMNIKKSYVRGKIKGL